MGTTVFESLSRKQQYKYPYIFLGCYITFMLTTVCLANKLTLVGNLLLPGGIFVFPFTFGICDVVGEVYGYAYPRIFIWIGVLAEFIFSLIVIGVSHMASPEYFKSYEAYQIVFDPTFRYVMSGLVGLLIGEFLNVYLLAKCKIVMRGRFFIFRSLLSTAVGQAFLTVIVDLLNYIGKMPIIDLISMMFSGFFWKMFFAVLLAFPAWILVRYLKKYEHIDFYDINTNFNPFIFSLNDKKVEDTWRDFNVDLIR
ncbi:MAG: integral membrane family protein [Legionellales bacterium RIFCSPHIGHO2_12_FULL_35_11]|nr:MAG: integral membrane family protein [Legionellales bacterium RIFCSPHIGHO2_12_FULL_35_11]